MKIKFSRHAKRRMRLYNIDINDVMGTIKTYEPDTKHVIGVKEVLNRAMSEKYRYPLKVVYTRENDSIHIITVYPLKRGLKL